MCSLLYQSMGRKVNERWREVAKETGLETLCSEKTARKPGAIVSTCDNGWKRGSLLYSLARIFCLVITTNVDLQKYTKNILCSSVTTSPSDLTGRRSCLNSRGNWSEYPACQRACVEIEQMSSTLSESW